MRSQKSGFTLIELLVVIAIIALLAVIVMISVRYGRLKGVDAAVRSQLQSARSQAEIYGNIYHGLSYTGVCTASNGIQSMLVTAASSSGAYGIVVDANETANPGGTVFCHGGQSEWVIQAPLSGTSTYWCLDSTGTSKATSGPAYAAMTSCG